MSSVAEISWSTSVEEADWLKERLASPAGSTTASIVPGGFEAYGRVLHPARLVEGEDDGGREARWTEVAKRSGMPLLPNARFHSVALPSEARDGAKLSECRPPRRGSLTPGDAAALASVLRYHTADADRTWFCFWDGHAWQGPLAEAIPIDVLDGPKVGIGRREYLLYEGPVEAAVALADAGSQTANVWWPADRSWCVVSDLDLPWTYVAGSAHLIAQLVDHGDLEVLPANADDPVRRVESWVDGWVASGVDQLMRTGNGRIETSRGVIEAWFERPGLQPGALGIQVKPDDGRRWGRRTNIEHRVDVELRRLLGLHLTMHVIDLVEG